MVAGDDDNGVSDDIDGKDDVYPVDAAADNAEPDNSFVFVPVLAGFFCTAARASVAHPNT